VLQALVMGENVCNLTALTSLDLAGNLLHIPGVKALAQGCSKLPDFVYLHCGAALRGEADRRVARSLLGDHVEVEMTDAGDSNEWVMESWQVQE
jgi:hypothetical protein